MNDCEYMRRALELAEKGRGFVSPNPMVGAVVVKNGKIIAEGWHHKCGDLHAERDALKNCRESAEGATMYVTLEPCSHYGKQPPCVEAIIESGIKRVVVGAGDPNPLVAGRGIKILRDHGIEVEENVLNEECLEINEVFFHYISTKTPFTVMKYAMTADGKIATHTGASRWISCEESRKHAHSLRHMYSAIMVGSGTVIADDPMLTCRIEGGKNPVRIVCDSRLRIPVNSKLVKTARDVPVIVATLGSGSHECSCERGGAGAADVMDSDERAAKIRALESAGCRVIETGECDGHIDLNELMEILGGEGIDSILIEGGGTLNWSAVKAGIVKKSFVYIAPKIFGGACAATPVSGKGFDTPDESLKLKIRSVERIGDDILVESGV